MAENSAVKKYGDRKFKPHKIVQFALNDHVYGEDKLNNESLSR
jgi:hypothetical protein